MLARCQSIQAPAIPLAVRSPYLQAYLAHNTGASVPNSWPNFWTTDHILGWSGLLRVDNALYEWLGDAAGGPDLSLANNVTAKPATLISFQITPTRSILSLQAGKMDINVTFLSPIEPSDLVLQSFPFTYIYFEASSTDGNLHSLQVYQDISAEWVGFDTIDEVQWNTTNGAIIWHQVQLSSPQPMTEQNDMAQDAVAYHVTASGSNVTYQTGSDLDVRSLFLNNGSLANTQDLTYRSIKNSWPVFAFCNDLGNILSTNEPVVWAIGLVRDGDIVYSTPSGNQTRRPYFFTKYQDVPSAMSDFLSDASNALQRAIHLDNKLSTAATSISSNYSDLVSLASRQVMAGLEITIGVGPDGQINKSDILVFVKDTGNSQRTNPMEVLYAALPAFIYFNASWIGYMLEPLLQYENSGLYAQSFATSDLGDTFPAAIGDPSPDLSTAIEGTSEMLVMVWAHVVFTGDVSLISRYYSTLKAWTETLLTENLLIPNGYVNADGVSNANMTNLAISGILAVRTMAEISRTLGRSDDYMSYSRNASSLVSLWQTLAVSSGHLTSTYGASSSWGMMYSLYSDKLFGFNLVNSRIYTEQTSWYITAASLASPFGLPFDSNERTTVKSHWTLFAAGTVTDNNTRDILVSMVHQSATNPQSFEVFPTTYSTIDGTIIGGGAR
ncbi:hypothetical protein BDP27DRAFT_1380628 [Rhodocollybia butyracea]|uniref:DUF1793-domain-containing protein n=1 Tax=Rhodocollybia butyracea TaxID=206335 RepID=A0A9P5PZL0_9AGAR|nr:hypothetical protein BDP27DRAFT_1380628 [Rhodocollybia butyracea]